MNLSPLTTATANAAAKIAKAAITRLRRIAAPLEIKARNGLTTTRELAAGELTLIGDELAAIGANPEFIRRFSGESGKAVAKAWRARTGTEPRKVWTRSRTTGHPIHVMAYPATKTGRDAIATGFATYKRTAALLAA